MSGTGKNTGNVRLFPLSTWVQLAVAIALILTLTGCGSGSTSGSSGQKDTTGDEQSTGEVKEQSTPGITAQGEEPPKTVEQAAGGDDGELGAPALGDPGAPVVMVEYSDYQ